MPRLSRIMIGLVMDYDGLANCLACALFHSQKGLVVVGINKDELVDNAKSFLANSPRFSCLLVFDDAQTEAHSFGFKAMPSI